MTDSQQPKPKAAKHKSSTKRKKDDQKKTLPKEPVREKPKSEDISPIEPAQENLTQEGVSPKEPAQETPTPEVVSAKPVLESDPKPPEQKSIILTLIPMLLSVFALGVSVFSLYKSTLEESPIEVDTGYLSLREVTNDGYKLIQAKMPIHLVNDGAQIGTIDDLVLEINFEEKSEVKSSTTPAVIDSSDSSTDGEASSSMTLAPVAVTSADDDQVWERSPSFAPFGLKAREERLGVVYFVGPLKKPSAKAKLLTITLYALKGEADEYEEVTRMEYELSDSSDPFLSEVWKAFPSSRVNEMRQKHFPEL